MGSNYGLSEEEIETNIGNDVFNSFHGWACADLEEIYKSEYLGGQILRNGLRDIVEEELIGFDPKKKVYPIKRIKDNDRYSFITLSLDKKFNENRFDFNESTIHEFWKNIKVLIENIDQKYPIDGYIVWVESGKNEKSPNLHSHMIIDFKDATKNLARFVRDNWNELFPHNKMVKANEYSNEPFTGKYLEDKIYYCFNEYKDSHTNFMDLTAPPFEGLEVRGSLTAKYNSIKEKTL